MRERGVVLTDFFQIYQYDFSNLLLLKRKHKIGHDYLPVTLHKCIYSIPVMQLLKIIILAKPNLNWGTVSSQKIILIKVKIRGVNETLSLDEISFLFFEIKK